MSTGKTTSGRQERGGWCRWWGVGNLVSLLQLDHFLGAPGHPSWPGLKQRHQHDVVGVVDFCTESNSSFSENFSFNIL